MFNAIARMARLAILCSAWTLAPQAGSAQTLASLPPVSVAAQEVGQARPLVAWGEFCRRYASECSFDRTEPTTIALTPKVWQTINTINRRVNTTIKPITDEEHWGVADRWDLAEDGSGDCEDFQLLKRKLLAEAGFPRRAMRMTVVIDEKREGHAVLMLRTDHGDFILDNKTDAVSPWFATGYTYVKRESQDAISWVSLGGATSPTVTANR
jgi:predicted transglutaminase-like cysteine proteinase